MTTKLDLFDEIGLSTDGLYIKQINNFLGSTPFSVTITPTLAASTFFFFLSAHWVIDTGLASGGTTISCQIHYQFNGTDRINWTAIFSELIDDYMDDEGFFFVPNGSNSITFFTSLGALNVANGYFVFKGFFQ